MSINRDLTFFISGYQCDFAQVNTKELPEITESTKEIFKSLGFEVPASLLHLKKKFVK